MTSPEWLAADEDDADRFPQTSHASAQISTHSPDEGSQVVPDPARVARYAEAISSRIKALTPLPNAIGGNLMPGATEFDIARAAVAVADGERAALVELVREMGREAVTEAEAYRAVLARAEAAEAAVERLRGERDLLAQAMWDARGALGFDNDGDKTPAASMGDIARFAANHVREAKEQARDYETALDLWDGTERREWVARAEAAEAKVAKVEALIPSQWEIESGIIIRPEALRAVLADAPAEHPALVFVDKETHEPCPTRGKGMSYDMDPQKVVGWCQQDLSLVTSGTMARVSALAIEVERQRARAVAAEAKVAKFKALADAVRALRARVHASKERGAAYDAWVLTDLLDSALEGHTCTDPNAECWACAVLADAPAEQRADRGTS